MTDQEENTKRLLCYINKVCPQELDNIELLKFFQLLIAAHWESTSNHGRYETYLSCIGTKGLVTTTLDSNPKLTPTAPSIQIKIGDTKFTKAHIGDANGESADGNEVTFAWNTTSTITFSHLFETPGETQIAVASTLEFLCAIANEVRTLLGLTFFQPAGISTPKKEKNSGSDNFNLDIVFNISYNYYVSANLETHRIKVIASNISIS